MNECGEALNIKGSSYVCDSPDAGHTVHGNRVAGAIWGQARPRGRGRAGAGTMREEVPVPAEYLLWAFRYCIDRKSYAHSDAHYLLRRYWPVMRQWQDGIVADLEWSRDYLLATSGFKDLGEMCVNTLAWIQEQEEAAQP